MKKIMSIMFLVISYILILTSCLYAANNIPEDNITYPIRITLDNGITGSGLYLSDTSHVYLVTAKHVLFDINSTSSIKLNSNSATLISYNKYTETNYCVEIKLNLQALYDDNCIKTHPKHDVTVALIGKVDKIDDSHARTSFSNKYVHFQSSYKSMLLSEANNLASFNDVAIGNDVYLFGYPISIGMKNIPQFEYNKPLLRKGVIAGKNNLNQTIILDCPVYPGNSGSPVIEIKKDNLITRFIIIGIVTQFIPYIDTTTNKQTFVNFSQSNSGYSVVVPTDAISELFWK